MTSPPLDSTHGRTTLGVGCNHRLLAAQTVERRRAWHAIIALGQQTRQNNVGHGMKSPPLDSTHGRKHWVWHDITALGQHTRSNDVGCGMPSSPFGSTHGRTTSGVACHHHLWAAQMVKRRQAWNAIIAFRLAHTVGRRRAWHDIIALGRQTRSNDAGQGMPSSPLGSTHGRTTSGMACHHRLWEANMVLLRCAWHYITAIGKHPRW